MVKISLKPKHHASIQSNSETGKNKPNDICQTLKVYEAMSKTLLFIHRYYPQIEKKLKSAEPFT